jgi:16S rRNA U516 pseudouridylate synthase RsuA-like enzyme
MRHINFNKACGVLSPFTDEDTGYPTRREDIEAPGVYAVGRQNRDREGLLLFTSDALS